MKYIIEFLKNKEKVTLLEPLLLFSVFFLPGYISQGMSDYDFTMFNSVYFNLYYIAQTLPQIMLILYIIILKPKMNLKDYSILRFKLRDIPKAIIILIGIYLCFFLVGNISLFFEDNINNAVVYGNKWTFNSPSLLPLIFISCLLTGYCEEIFFRSYLYTSLIKAGTPVYLSIILSSVLFGSGHLYEGYFAFAATSIIGAFLAFAFIKTKSIHAVSIAHGFYNFSVLLLSLQEGGLCI